MLYNGVIVYFSEISNQDKFDPSNLDLNLSFFNSLGSNSHKIGRVKKFKKNSIGLSEYYMAIFRYDDEFVAYYRELMFWQNNYNKSNSLFEIAPSVGLGLPYFPPTIRFLEINDNTKVYFISKKIVLESAVFTRRLRYGFKLYKDIVNTDSLLTIDSEKIQIVDTPIASPFSLYGKFIIDKQYLAPNQELRELDTDDHSILSDIIYILSELLNEDSASFGSFLISKGLNAPFNTHILIYDRYNSVAYGTIDERYHYIYNEEYFELFRLRLIEFWNWVSNYKDDYTKIDINELTVYIINLFDANDLSAFDYNLKIDLLYRILKDNNWITGDWEFNKLVEEDALIKVISTIYYENNDEINYAEINDFMDLLMQTPKFDVEEKRTLYQYLYEKLDDPLLFSDSGNGNQGKFVKLIYFLWSNSKFNPSIESTEFDNIDFDYSMENGSWQFYDFRVTNAEFDETKCPLNINLGEDLSSYSHNIFINWKFIFKGNKIQSFEFGFLPNKQNKYYLLRGTYHFFQPVILTNATLNDANVKMPVLNPTINDPCANGGKTNSNIPLFYLLYFQKLNSYIDFKTDLGLFVDIAVTFSGIGNLTKLRFISKFSWFRKAMGLIPGKTLTATEASYFSFLVKQGLFSSFEALSGIAHSVLTLSGSCDDNIDLCNPETDPAKVEQYEKCKAYQDWLLYLDLFVISGDLAFRQMFKKKTQRLLEKLPVDFNPDYLLELTRLADFSREVDKFFNKFLSSHPNASDKIVELTFDANKKLKFYLMYKDKPDFLIRFENNIDYITNWSKLYDKSLFNVIDDLSFIRSQARVDTYIRFYDDIDLRPKIEALDNAKKVKFLDQFEDLTVDEFNVFQSLPVLIEKWDKFYSNIRLQKEFSKLSKSGALSFLQKFGDIDSNLLDNISKNKDFFKHWDELTDLERAAKTSLEHFDDFYEVKLLEIVNVRYGKSGYFEPFIERTGLPKPRRRHELRSWADTEIIFESRFISSGKWPNGKHQPGDAYGISGRFKGKWVDWTGVDPNIVLNFDHIGNPSKYLKQIDALKKSIDKHLLKTIVAPDGTEGLLDYYICDMKYFTAKMKEDVFEHLNNLIDPRLKSVRESEKFILINN